MAPLIVAVDLSPGFDSSAYVRIRDKTNRDRPAYSSIFGASF